MSTPLANYDGPRKAFEALLSYECDRRILLMRGDSGSGKTTLLLHCCGRISQTATQVAIQLRGTAVNVPEIFSRTGQYLSWARLTHFTKRLADFEGGPSVQIDRNWLLGINNRINVLMHAENEADREQRRATLTDALFEDLATYERPVVVLFDTFEQAPTEVQNWLSGPFLSRAARTNQVRVVIAGQTVPTKDNIEWGHCCNSHDLYGVLDAQHWMPVVQEMQRHIPFPDPGSWLAGVCYALNGRPNDIMKVIEGLPHEEMFA